MPNISGLSSLSPAQLASSIQDLVLRLSGQVFPECQRHCPPHTKAGENTC